MTLKLTSQTFSMGQIIPDVCAHGALNEQGIEVLGENLTPHLAWSGVPEGTRSWMLACIDDDVPVERDQLEATGCFSPLISRRRFVHWVQIDIPLSVQSLEQGILSGANKLDVRYGRTGFNDYLKNPDLNAPLVAQVGVGYDGPHPPQVDSRWHFYHFVVLALDVPTLDVPAIFTWSQAFEAAQGHILASASLVGRYTLNLQNRLKSM